MYIDIHNIGRKHPAPKYNSAFTFHNLLKDKNINEGLNELSTWNRDACLQSIFANQTAHQWRFCGQASQLQGERLCWKTIYKTILIDTESMKVQEDAFSAYCEYWWTMNINDESGEHCKIRHPPPGPVITTQCFCICLMAEWMCLGVCVYVNIFSYVYTDTEAPPQSKYTTIISILYGVLSHHSRY